MTRLVLSVSLNPALDISYSLDEISVGAQQYVHDVRGVAGGTGLHVARFVRMLGGHSHAFFTSGGANGVQIERYLRGDQMPYDVYPVVPNSRRRISVVEADGRTTTFIESSPVFTPDVWEGFHDRLLTLLSSGIQGEMVNTLILTGSLPRGVPQEAYALLVLEANRHGIRTIVDCPGPPLMMAVEAQPTMVTPNNREIESITGQSGASGLRALQNLSPHTVVVSTHGAEGIMASSPSGVWQARLPMEFPGNTMGAGAAVIASLAIGVMREQEVPRMLQDAVGAGGAVVLHRATGYLEAAAAYQLSADAEVWQVTD